jgi:23S rRNA pseudouridine2605 synthase
LSAERLQKVLASAGIASRRDCEELISAGRVSVNGKVVVVAGTRVDPAVDEITLDGQPIGKINPRTYVMLHKPVGVVSTADDPQGRPTVVAMVNVSARLFPVGRLDYDSEGLLLLTDDGELTQRLTHPSYQVEKEYRALLNDTPSPDALREWRNGVLLDEARTAPAWVEVLERTDEGVWVRVVLHEGRKRQIREVAQLLGYDVLRLIRVREGPIVLGELPLGEWRNLTEAEVEALWSHVGGRDAQLPAPEPRAPRSHSRPERTNAPAAPANDQEETSTQRNRFTARGPRRDDRPSYSDRGPRRDDRPSYSDRGPRRDDRPSYSDRGPRRDDRPSYSDRGPRRDDRPSYSDRGPRRDDRPSYSDRGPRRDDRPSYSDRGPRRDDRPSYSDRGPRRDDRPSYNDRGPRRDDRPSYNDRSPRRDDRPSYNDRGPRRNDRPSYSDRGRFDDRGPRNEGEHRPDRGNERFDARQQREEKRGPGRDWQANNPQETRRSATRDIRDNKPSRYGARGGTLRRTGFPFRPRPKRDEADES